MLSTGSAVALPFFALGRARRLPCHYVESAARIDGASLTGRLLTRIPGVRFYAQYRDWADSRWRFRGSVFDSYAVTEAEPPPLRRVVVSLGTSDYDFSRLVNRLLEILPADVEVVWQTGKTDVSELGIDGRSTVPEAELADAMSEADAIVTHAGVGSALSAFEVGKAPLLVPRRFAWNEHVDDHQTQIAGDLSRRGLARAVEADDLTLADLEAVAAQRVVKPAQAPTFEITG